MVRATIAEAFELTLGSEYTRGLGSLQEDANPDVGERAGNGVSSDPGLGYRATPRWMLGMRSEVRVWRRSAGRNHEPSR